MLRWCLVRKPHSGNTHCSFFSNLISLRPKIWVRSGGSTWRVRGSLALTSWASALRLAHVSWARSVRWLCLPPCLGRPCPWWKSMCLWSGSGVSRGKPVRKSPWHDEQQDNFRDGLSSVGTHGSCFPLSWRWGRCSLWSKMGFPSHLIC